MARIAAALLCLALAACSTTSTIYQPLPQQGSAVRACAYSFENNGGDDLEGIRDRCPPEGLATARLAEAAERAAFPQSGGRPKPPPMPQRRRGRYGISTMPITWITPLLCMTSAVAPRA